MKNSQRF